MPLTPGTRLGVYEILAAIGEGGMGQVFRARDTKLDRDVAIEILPDAFAHDADCLVAACAIHRGITVVHRDREYAALARVSPLLERDLRA